MSSPSLSAIEIGRQAFARPDDRPIYAWASEHVRLHTAYTVTGKFDISRSHYLRDVFDALRDDTARMICVRAPARTGKSLIADIWLPWLIAHDPGPFMWVFADDFQAKRHAEEKIMPLLDACEPLAQYMPADRHKKRTKEILFSHGMSLEIHGPSVSKLQEKGVRYLVLDEIWEWEPGRIAQAMGRLGDYEEINASKVLLISQAGLEDDDEDQYWRSGDQSEWQVPCLRCGAYVWPGMFQVRADGSKCGLICTDDDSTRDANGDYILSAALRTVRYVCPRCDHTHASCEATRLAWNDAGKYVPQNPRAEPTRRSFRWSGVATRQWVLLMQEYLLAMNAFRRGVIEPIMVFSQKRIPEPWSEQKLFDLHPTPTFETGKKWEHEVDRYFTVDRQADGLHWGTIWSWSKDGRSRRLWFGQMRGEDDIVARQREFQVPSCHVLIDSGFEAKRVYAMCVKWGWIALKGDDREAFQHHLKRRDGRLDVILRSYSKRLQGDPELGRVTQGRRFAPLILWSNPTIKDRLQRHLESGRHEDPVADPQNELERVYRRQMRAEYKRAKRDRNGRVRMVWVCPSGENHAFDCAAMQVVAATLRRRLPDIDVHDRAGASGSIIAT